jgi:Xaa-Pro aminopeptidase
MQRLAELKRIAFDETKFDGFLIFNTSNLLYFTSFPGNAALLIPRDGDATAHVYSVNYEQSRTEAKGFTVERVERGENLIAKIASQVKDAGIKNLALDALGIESWRSLAKETRGNVKLKAKPALVSQLRVVKDEAEIAVMRKAGELTSLGMETAYEVLRAGMSEIEVAAEIEYAMRKHGSYGTAFDTAVSSGSASAFPHGGCSDRKIREGELVVVDFGAVNKFYRSDMTRTIVVGKPSEKQMKLHKIVKMAQEEALAAIKPNAKASEVDAVARNVIEDAGYGEYFVHGLGHGVGLDIHEPPTLNTVSKEKLQAGNVITDEPGIYLPGYGGVRIEDTLLVAKNGAEKLTKGPYGLGREKRLSD